MDTRPPTKKSDQVEGRIRGHGWDRIPNLRFSAPINPAFHVYNFKSVGRRRWGGGGRGEKVMSIMEGRGKGELFFTDNVLKMPNINPASRFCVSSLNWVWDFTFPAHLESCMNLPVKLVHKLSLSASCSNCFQSIKSLWYVREDWASTYWLQPF